MSKHEDLYQEAKEAIDRLFSDTSVDQEQTAESLKSLIHEIQDIISTLDV